MFTCASAKPPVLRTWKRHEDHLYFIPRAGDFFVPFLTDTKPNLAATNETSALGLRQLES